jgi:hypothetical protein
MSEQKRGIRDNSKITEAKAFKDFVSEDYQSLNPVDNELIKLVKRELKSIQRILSKCVDKHRASHGAETCFHDEVCNQKEIDKYGDDPVFGNYRVGNRYEKSKLAVECEQELNDTNNRLAKVIYQDLEKVEVKDDN